MQDQPSTVELLTAVRNFLRDTAMTQLKDHAAFHARVATNAMDIVLRELDTAPKRNAEETERLRQLLEMDADLETLNRELCSRIRTGDISLDTPGFTEHLWETTLTKMAIDQPKYAAYRREMESREG